MGNYNLTRILENSLYGKGFKQDSAKKWAETILSTIPPSVLQNVEPIKLIRTLKIVGQSLIDVAREISDGEELNDEDDYEDDDDGGVLV